MNKVNEEGYDAYFNGTKNPYNINSDEWLDFEVGYRWAFQDKNDDEREDYERYEFEEYLRNNPDENS